MITTAPKARKPRTGGLLFGSLSVDRGDGRKFPLIGINPRRLALVAGLGLLLTYTLLVAAGYVWLHHVRGVQEITVADIALVRWKQVRREIGASHFQKARAAWEARDFRSVFVWVASALRNDPANIEGRMMSAGYFQTAGLLDNATRILEDGLNHAPAHPGLIERTLELLCTTGRDRRALALIHGKLAPQLTGPNAIALGTFELLATLNADGPAAARRLLDTRPHLRRYERAQPVIARVLWESGEKDEAVYRLSDYNSANPKTFSSYGQLCAYLQALGRMDEARATARRACEHFPAEPGPRLLLIATLTPSGPDKVPAWWKEIVSYLGDFGARPEAVSMLSGLAGRAGWVELSRLLYETGATRQADARLLALNYGDALVVTKRHAEARALLLELAQQTGERDPFALMLLQRQIIAANAMGAHDDVRDYARRLASNLRRDPVQLAMTRTHFQNLGIAEAVAELAPPAPKTAPKKTGPG